MIEKTTKTKVTNVHTETVTQGLDDCNQRVRALFLEKPELQSVTLTFATGDVQEKVYQRA